MAPKTAPVSRIDPELTYESVRKEILDQKKCQFQIFSAALTLTAAVLAYAATTKVGPIIYLAPVVMNVLALTMIFDKAISIHRMVGYLQIMESDNQPRRWMWEYHLNCFRETPGISMGMENFRKHTYIRNVALMLLLLTVGSTLLFFFGPEAVSFRQTSEYENMRGFYGALSAFAVTMTAVGMGIAGLRISQLVFGKYTTKAIYERWIRVLKENP